MRSNKKLARALAGVMIGSQVLTTVPITNVVPVFASEVNMNESTTSSKSVESTLIANAEDLGGEVVVTIPNKMTLALNNETKTLGASSEVYAKGICGVLDSLTVSVTSDKINFVNKNKATDTVEADVNFGTDNTAKWTADQLIDGLNDELALVKQPIKLETNKSSIKHMGDYQAETEFNISLGDNRNNWEAQATSLFNYKEITEGDNKGTIQITGLTDDGASYLSDEAGADGLLAIPEVIEDKAVTEIGEGAFGNCTSLESIHLPSTLTYIHNHAFVNCTSLKDVNLQEGLTTLGQLTFENCTSLTDITIPSTLTKTENYSGYEYCAPFKNSGLTTATVTNGATTIPDILFAYATNLTTINLPDTITEIGEGAFGNCTSLSEINLPDGLTTIKQAAFAGCTVLTEITIPSTVNSTNDAYYYGIFGGSGLTTVTVANGATVIPTGLFKGATNLTTVNLPEGLTNINNNAFENCTSLESITIPSSVLEIGERAFDSCTSLKDVNLPEGLTTINQRAFENCTSLTNITIPSTVNVDTYWTDREGVFNGSGLTTATVANGATVIPHGLFKNATNLTTVNLPEGLTNINNNVFENCTSLKSLTIPSSVTNMNQDSIFESCSGLTEINYDGTIEAFKASGFRTKSTSQTITVHCSDGDYEVQ